MSAKSNTKKKGEQMPEGTVESVANIVANIVANDVSNTAVEAAAPVDLGAALVIIPQKVCVQIGQRKRYFDTKGEALAALEAFNAKASAKSLGPKRTFLTPEQKAEIAEKRKPLMDFAASHGLEGKKQAMLANTLQEVIAVIPGVYDLIKEYVDTVPAAPVAESADEPTNAPAAPDAEPSFDQLAEFNV